MIYNTMNDVYISGTIHKIRTQSREGWGWEEGQNSINNVDTYIFLDMLDGGSKYWKITRPSFMDGPFEGFPRLF